MNENKFLLVKGKAGLGNRILSVLNGILFALLSGKELIIVWRDSTYSNDGSNVFHRFFICWLFGPTDEIPNTDSMCPCIWRSHLHETVGDMEKLYGNYINTESRIEALIDLYLLKEYAVVSW